MVARSKSRVLYKTVLYISYTRTVSRACKPIQPIQPIQHHTAYSSIQVHTVYIIQHPSDISVNTVFTAVGVAEQLVAVIKESAACILMASYLTSSASGVFLIYMISTLER